MFINIPNILTLSRIVMIPIIIYLSFDATTTSKYLIFLLFVYCGITDYLDGYLARKLKKTSMIGKLMDPIADKFLTTSVLLILINQNILNNFLFIAALVIILRELLISGLREFLSSLGHDLPVTNFAKIKTTIQFLSLGFILFGSASNSYLLLQIGFALLWLAVLFTIVSGYIYLKEGVKYLN